MRNVSTLIVLAGALVLAGCSGKEAAPTDARRHAARLDEHLSLGEPVTVGNLTVWPVFTDQPADLGEFLTLQEALDGKLAELREVGDAGQAVQVIESEEEEDTEGAAPESAEDAPGDPGEGQQLEQVDFDGPAIRVGAVNTLWIENKGDLPILICAGTVVTGGNQDRQIGQDIVVKARSSVPVDAFCVEQGRWEGERLGKATEGQFVAAGSNAMIGVRTKGQYEIAQDLVWEEVAKVKQAVLAQCESSEAPFALISRNSSLAVALDATHALTGEEIDAICGKVRAHFAGFGKGDAPVGFAYAVNGRAVNVRSFANAEVFARQFDPFLRSMATESLLAGKVEHAAAKASDVVALVQAMARADEEKRETAALNWNGVRRSSLGFSANCYVPSDGAKGGKQVAVTRDWTARQE